MGVQIMKTPKIFPHPRARTKSLHSFDSSCNHQLRVEAKMPELTRDIWPDVFFIFFKGSSVVISYGEKYDKVCEHIEKTFHEEMDRCSSILGIRRVCISRQENNQSICPNDMLSSNHLAIFHTHLLQILAFPYTITYLWAGWIKPLHGFINFLDKEILDFYADYDTSNIILHEIGLCVEHLHHHKCMV